MSKERLKRKKNRQLFIKNRLVILNEDTFEEIFLIEIESYECFIVAWLAILLISVTTFTYSFYGNLFQGYSSSN
jgi:hypothetical protein